MQFLISATLVSTVFHIDVVAKAGKTNHSNIFTWLGII